MNIVKYLTVMETLDKWSKNIEKWITDNYSNPLLWVGILGGGLLFFKIIGDAFKKGGE